LNILRVPSLYNPLLILEVHPVHGIDVERVVRRRPFRPFRIALTTNEQFDIVHPDLVVIDDRFVAVGSPRGAAPDDEELIVYWIDLNHIVYLRRL
jgi:hypothetical protein